MVARAVRGVTSADVLNERTQLGPSRTLRECKSVKITMQQNFYIRNSQNQDAVRITPRAQFTKYLKICPKIIVRLIASLSLVLHL